MPLLEMILTLTIAVTITNVLSHYLPDIPVSLFQIGIGLAVASLLHQTVDVETEWFLLLFVAPLLFNDAWRFPKRELWNLRGPILANAILLVLLTTLVGGFLIHALMPQLPTTVALALAAVISPTDPVAVQAIAHRVKLPSNILHVVAGESLINDASGLVAFNTAIKATVAGSFVLGQAFENFIWVAVGGALVGVVGATLVTWFRDKLARAGMDDVIFHTVVTLMMPFAMYLLAEEIFHASGVIAVVAAAIIAKLNDDQRDAPELTLIMVASWDVFAYVLNGSLFVLLGMILPEAFHAVIENPAINTFVALRDGLLVWLIVFMARVIWSYLTQVTYKLRHRDQAKPSVKLAFISGLTGVRGAVTMAAVLSVPTVLADGTEFPQRALVIFVAAVVVITSLLVATIMLPLVTHERAKVDFTQKPDETVNESTEVADLAEEQARILALRYGVQVLRERQQAGNRTLIDELIWQHQIQIKQLQRQLRDDIGGAPFSKAELILRQVGLAAEREKARELLQADEISELVYQAHSRRLDRVADMTGSPVTNVSWKLVRLAFRRGWRTLRLWFADESADDYIRGYNLAKRQMGKAAIKALSAYVNENVQAQKKDEFRQVAYHLVLSYRHQVEQAKRAMNPAHRYGAIDKKKQMELEIISLNAQREAVQQLYDAKRISRKAHLRLREYINYTEAAVLKGDVEEAGA